MDDSVFVLNNSFTVDTSRNLIINIASGTETRLEPRLMQILCLLAKNCEQLVSRELLISTIWNDYGGAEDGLNQGISFLRKALGDGNKQIIETVPKKGYILHATVSDGMSIKKAEPQKQKSVKKQVYFWAGFLGGAIFVFILFFMLNKNEVSSKKEKNYPVSLPVDSTVSKNWNGKNYKLVIGRNDKVRLYENNMPVADSNLINYAIVIQDLKDKLTSQQDAGR